MDVTEDINDELDAIFTESISKETVNKFKTLLTRLEGKSDAYILEAVSKISNSISQDIVTIPSARQICGELIAFIEKFTDDSLAITNFQVLLSRMQFRLIAFEAQLTELRDLLAKRLMNSGQLREAAVVLSGMPLESGQRSYTLEYKLGIYLRIVECYLALNDPTQAEVFMNRASLLQNDSKDQNLIMRFKAAYARLLDFKQKFLEAGQRYAELSIRFPEMDETERAAFLERALLSALLAGAGQQRARLLATLYKDERCQSLQAYPILEKMYMRRLINRDSLHSLRPLLIHYYPQLFAPTTNNTTTTNISNDESATVATGDAPGDAAVVPPASSQAKTTDDAEAEATTVESPSYQEFLRVLERVVVEHNMLAASLIYTNISLANLGELLEVEPNQAEAIAAQMIGEGRLDAQIDQIDGFIHFEKENPAVTLSTQIQNLWTSVNSIIEGIESDHPAWVAAHST